MSSIRTWRVLSRGSPAGDTDIKQRVAKQSLTAAEFKAKVVSPISGFVTLS